MKQTFTETEVYNDLTDESGIRIMMKVEKREPTPILDELARRMYKPTADRLEQEWLDELLDETKSIRKKYNE